MSLSCIFRNSALLSRIMRCAATYSTSAPFHHKTGTLTTRPQYNRKPDILNVSSLLCQSIRQLQTSEKSKPGESKTLSDEELFDEEFKTISDFLTSHIKKLHLQEVSLWFEQVLKYNVPHGKRNRGLGVMKTYKYLTPTATTEERRLAAILGWCIEMCQAFFLITDDVMDQSITRRGMPCWFRQKEVGLMAVNDAVLIECGIFQLLKAYFRHHPNYIDMVDVFHETIHFTSSGQCLDILSSNSETTDLDKCTEKRYSAIVHLKTAQYTFCLPVRLALLLAEQGDSYTKEVESLLLTIGNFFQVQDDYLDGFGDPAVTGKQGTDIEEGKCSWPLVMALKRVSSQDRKILEENYGKNNPDCVNKVMDIYRKVDIPKLFEEYETETYLSLCRQIEAVTQKCNIPIQVFYGLLNKVYKRSK